MPSSPKRAAVPASAFGQPRTALDKLTRSDTAPVEAEKLQERTTALPSHVDTGKTQNGNSVIPSNSNNVTPQNSKTETAKGAAGASEKVSFYLRPDQLDKLDELALAYKRATNTRGAVNRNDVIRRMVDVLDLPTLLGDEL